MPGPRPEDNIRKARNLVMTTTPSAAAKDLRDLMCQKSKPFTNCCCGPIVASHWRDLLPDPVKFKVADADFTANFDTA